MREGPFNIEGKELKRKGFPFQPLIFLLPELRHQLVLELPLRLEVVV